MTRPCELHVTWLRSEDADATILEEASAWLDAAERARVDRFARTEDATDFLLGRWLARRALAVHTRTEPADWGFEIGPHGKPSGRGPSATPPAFNLSHGGRLIVCVASHGPGYELGVDVEAVARRLPGRRLERFLTPRELAALGPDTEEPYTRRFWRTWTLKEAVLKAAGTGIAGTLSAAEIELHDEGGPRVRPGLELDRIQLLELPIAPTHCVSAAVDAVDAPAPGNVRVASIDRAAPPPGA